MGRVSKRRRLRRGAWVNKHIERERERERNMEYMRSSRPSFFPCFFFPCFPFSILLLPLISLHLFLLGTQHPQRAYSPRGIQPDYATSFTAFRVA